MIKKYKYLLILILLFTSKSHALSPEYEKELYIGCYSNSKAYIGPDGAKIYCQCTIDKLSAKFNDGNNPTIYVTSDKAIFNNNNFNTKFENNVKVTYMENIITSKNLDLDFDKNTIFIYNNVIYDGLTGAAKTDNIVIDLLTKNAEIFMNKPTQKVKVISK